MTKYERKMTDRFKEHGDNRLRLIQLKRDIEEKVSCERMLTEKEQEAERAYERLRRMAGAEK